MSALICLLCLEYGVAMTPKRWLVSCLFAWYILKKNHLDDTYEQHFHFFLIISENYSSQWKECYGAYVSWKPILIPSKREVFSPGCALARFLHKNSKSAHI